MEDDHDALPLRIPLRIPRFFFRFFFLFSLRLNGRALAGSRTIKRPTINRVRASGMDPMEGTRFPWKERASASILPLNLPLGTLPLMRSAASGLAPGRRSRQSTGRRAGRRIRNGRFHSNGRNSASTAGRCCCRWKTPR
jgi:hypothetical protein